MRVVIPSRHYGDMLAEILPAWQHLLPAEAIITVVTDRADHETRIVARARGVVVIDTDVWTADGARLNKARALDEGFGFRGQRIAPALGEICVAIDADTYPGGRFPSENEISPATLYGCERRTCVSPVDLQAFQGGTAQRVDFPIRNQARRVPGYCQIFRYRPGLTFGSFPDAGHYDLAFHRSFDAQVGLADFWVLHLGRTSSRNWKGRVLPRWRAA